MHIFPRYFLQDCHVSLFVSIYNKPYVTLVALGINFIENNFFLIQ